ncbi:synaptonemal complex protein 1 isoform X2 [Betta splendens]|uniref:Synaptonemal complex protein 1 isoform X2 n=1 Tax=Betta splendens TaxID=158456 RepID=A0A6P7MGH2_BETSP|nr:synaptonemal complex protein 1 isoform X2 [Betta splendens]
MTVTLTSPGNGRLARARLIVRMEKNRGFNFKLYVPPRVNSGQISADKPQDYSKCYDKEPNVTFSSTSLPALPKPPRQDFPKMKAVSPMKKDEDYCRPGQLYSKLFDEVEKIKCWKFKVDSDTVQKERLLQENKRIIETQRLAIQELQFGNESLSIKLEEQIAENEDLRNKNSATRNLCNLLKDTFERSAEKMNLFESEREETHHLFIENSESIQKLTAAFESLQIQTEADQEELQKAKESLLCLEELKLKYHECKMKKEEVAGLQATLKEKGDELEQALLELHESQKHCQQLQETTNQQCELLRSSKTQMESLCQKLKTAEQRCNESKESLEAITAAQEQSTKEYTKIIQTKDVSLQELIKVNSQQAEKLEQIRATIEELQSSLFLKIQRVKELEDELTANTNDMEKTQTLLGELMEQSLKKDEQIIILESNLDKRSKSFESMKCELDITNIRVAELTVELSKKNEEAKRFKTSILQNEAERAFAENDHLKKACDTAEKAHEDSKENSTIKVQELEAKLLFETRKNKEHVYQIELLRNDIILLNVKHDELLSKFNELQSEKMAIEQQFEGRSSFLKDTETKIKVSEERVVRLTKENHRLEEENQSLHGELNSIKDKIERKWQKAETLQKKFEENCEHLQKKVTEKEKQIKAVETKLCSFRKKIEARLKAKEEYQKESKLFKKQIAREVAKSSQLESVISSLHEESQNLKRLNEEDNQNLLKDLEAKSAFVAKLENELQELRLTAAEAMKNKEDAELKCQQKISDMVALMEKHKSQYDRMVEENEAELQENKKKEAEAVAHKKSLELDLLKHKTENDQLKKQLKKETREKEKLQKEMTDLKTEVSSKKGMSQLSEAVDKQSHVWNYKQGRCSGTPKESSSKRPTFDVFDFSKARKALYKDDGGVLVKTTESETESLRTLCGTSPKTKDIYTEEVPNSRSVTKTVGSSSKIKSYRIRTPPSGEKATYWGKAAIEIDPASDSPNRNDLLTLANTPTSVLSAPHCKASTRKKIQSPVTHKSPGNSLKLAAMKRMRDAGWIAVTGCDKKKKSNEKVFA